MKLRYIFTALAAAALAFVGCQEEERFLDEVQVSQSVVAIPVEGGQVEVTVTANDAWEIAGAPEWLSATPAAGEAGTHTVVFSAEATTETREGMFYRSANGSSSNSGCLARKSRIMALFSASNTEQVA